MESVSQPPATTATFHSCQSGDTTATFHSCQSGDTTATFQSCQSGDTTATFQSCQSGDTTATFHSCQSGDTTATFHGCQSGDSVNKLILCSLTFVVVFIVDRTLATKHKQPVRKYKLSEGRDKLGTDPFKEIGSCEADLHQHLLMCDKNPSHHNFVPVDKFTLSHLPPHYRDPDLLAYIQAVSDLTVRVSVTSVSERRSLTHPGSDMPYSFHGHIGSRSMMRVGTGYINLVTTENNKPCPCQECVTRSSPSMQWGKIYLSAATHVIFDESEAADTTCHLLFDRGDTPDLCPSVVSLHRWNLLFRDIKKDHTMMTYVTHDLDLINRLKKMCVKVDRMSDVISLKFQNNQDNEHPLSVIVSHPHGCSKQVSVGYITDRDEIENSVNLVQLTYTTSTCPGSSGALVLTLDRKKWCFTCALHCGNCNMNHELNYSGLGWK